MPGLFWKLPTCSTYATRRAGRSSTATGASRPGGGAAWVAIAPTMPANAIAIRFVCMLFPVRVAAACGVHARMVVPENGPEYFSPLAGCVSALAGGARA